MKNKDLKFFRRIENWWNIIDKKKNEVDTEKEITDTLEKTKFITNSENQNDCWYIKNPKIKNLTKKITLNLGPHCT